MPEERECKFCQTSFWGRPNQDFCSNAHKTAFHRLRTQREISTLLFTKVPLYFHFSYPSTFHERKSPQRCKELNLLYNAIKTIQEVLALQGRWKYEDMTEYFKQEAKGYSALSKSLKDKIENGEFSFTFSDFMGANLAKIPRLYKQVATKIRAALKKYATNEDIEEVEVKFEEEFVEKMKKLEEKFTQLWFFYKSEHL